MEKMTITEALAEVKLIQKKVEKKKELVTSNLFRYDRVKDPFESEGGSSKVLNQELQAITDLERRLVKIRSAIGNANQTKELTIGETTRTVYGWLVWKREVAENQIRFAKNIHQKLKSQIDQEATKPTIWRDEDQKVHITNLVTNVNYSDYLSLEQKLQEQYDVLDGKLSLFNATAVVEV